MDTIFIYKIQRGSMCSISIMYITFDSSPLCWNIESDRKLHIYVCNSDMKKKICQFIKWIRRNKVKTFIFHFILFLILFHSFWGGWLIRQHGDPYFSLLFPFMQYIYMNINKEPLSSFVHFLFIFISLELLFYKNYKKKPASGHTLRDIVLEKMVHNQFLLSFLLVSFWYTSLLSYKLTFRSKM